MSIFAPPYRPSERRQTFLTRQQNADSKKRKRGQDSDGEDEDDLSADPDSTPRKATAVFHPINKTDPYHVAGYSREHDLPPPPFPHAAIKDTHQPSKLSIEEELASLNPPLYVPAAKREDQSSGLKRRHADNLTTILHRCMLKGDWKRAERAWSLLIRTEIAGRGIDVRRNGRWGIGAELLMRRGAAQDRDARRGSIDDDDASTFRNDVDAVEDELPQFTDQGFQLAREYYERMILQYPHTPQTMHSLNATAIYPALFNIWIYEVQDRSRRARQHRSSSSDDGSNESKSEGHDRDFREIRIQELKEATRITERMDELLLSPPYDTSTSILRLRGMVALWVSDLHSEVKGLLSRLQEDLGDDDALLEEAESHALNAKKERRKAVDVFRKVRSFDFEITKTIREVIDTEALEEDGAPG